MSEADQMEDDKWQLTLRLSYSVGETIGSGGGSGQHLSGTAEPWLQLITMPECRCDVARFSDL